jgi:hypothetical protein
LPEWAALSGAVYAHEVTIATFEFQKLVGSGTSRLRNVFGHSFTPEQTGHNGVEDSKRDLHEDENGYASRAAKSPFTDFRYVPPRWVIREYAEAAAAGESFCARSRPLFLSRGSPSEKFGFRGRTA